jgi:YD repeat-containing protein
MTTSRWSSRVCDDPSCPPRSSRRTAASLAAAAGLAVLLAAAPAGAASNPGTGDSGFFTFRPAPAIGGTQINVASGNALIRTRDLASSAANYNVVVDRAYNSLAPDTFSILSPRWAFDVGPTNGLTVESNQDVTATGPSGYKIRFARQSDGSYTPPAGFDGSLTKTSSGWTLTRTSQNDQFGYDNNGKLVWTKDAAVRDFTVQGTSAAGRDVLSSYGTSSGRRVNLSYNGDSLVREMDDPSSGHHYYRYTNGRLTQYEAPGGAITTYRYDSNGRLDKITEPGGTTVELTTTAGGRVSSISTTLPGGTPKTTSFVYTRRPYKTDATAPDGVRRTYAYDDDWRVTRQYNPDVKPTVTASGALRDLADDYTDGRSPIGVSVLAKQPDGAGIEHLAVEEINGNELGHADPACTTTPFDRICPTDVSEAFSAELSALSEGGHNLRATARDDEQNVGRSEPWRVYIDRTGPSAVTGITSDYDEDESRAVLSWDEAADPDLPDGADGSGVAEYRVSYTVDNTTRQVTSDIPSIDLDGAHVGSQVAVTIIPIDRVGNAGPPTSKTLTVASLPLCEPFDPADDPVPAGLLPGRPTQLADMFVFQAPVAPSDLTSALPANTEVVAMLDRNPSPQSEYSSGLLVPSGQSVSSALTYWKDTLAEDMDDEETELNNVRNPQGTPAYQASLERQIAQVQTRRQRMVNAGGVPVRAIALVHDTAVASAMEQAFAGNIEQAAAVLPDADCASTGTSPTASVSPNARSSASSRDSAGGDEPLEVKDYSANSYSPPRVRVTSKRQQVSAGMRHKVEAAWSYGAASNTAYWRSKYRRSGTGRGTEVQVNMNRDSGHPFGYPYWYTPQDHFGPAPYGWDHPIPEVWNANFKCAYPDDYWRDDVENVGLTIGMACRPNQKYKRYRWAHILKPGDLNDAISVSVSPSHYAKKDHFPVSLPILGGLSEYDYCVNRSYKLGSCMFSDHGPATRQYKVSGTASTATATTPGNVVFSRR